MAVRLGLNAKLSEYSAAIGLAVWDRVMDEIQHKLELAQRIKAKVEAKVLTSRSGDLTVYQAVPIILNSPAHADLALQQLASAGFEAKHYYKPLTSAEETVNLYKCSVCLPCHSGLTLDLADEAIEIINSINNS